MIAAQPAPGFRHRRPSPRVAVRSLDSTDHAARSLGQSVVAELHHAHTSCGGDPVNSIGDDMLDIAT